MGEPLQVAVVGAGAFGGWTALELQRAGARVTLIDAHGAGNLLSSSGGDSRVLRLTYGDDRIYLDLAHRARELWRTFGRSIGAPLFRRTGALFLIHDDDRLVSASLPHLRDAGIEHESLAPGEISRRYPQIALDGIAGALFETGAGYLRARVACEAVRDAFVDAGGVFRRAAVRPGPITAAGLSRLQIDDGDKIQADRYLFACGPWLPRLFPDLLGPHFRVTRQEVFFFATPDGDPSFSPARLPVWADLGKRFWYGIPGSDGLGFKIADDTRGGRFDPETGDREPTAAGRSAAVDYLGFRFPGMRAAPLLEARVCQYTETNDGHFVFDRHPDAGNLWLAGGGSGHGFKHGPAFGELAAAAIRGMEEPPAPFRMDRFEPAPTGPSGGS